MISVWRHTACHSSELASHSWNLISFSSNCSLLFLKSCCNAVEERENNWKLNWIKLLFVSFYKWNLKHTVLISSKRKVLKQNIFEWHHNNLIVATQVVSRSWSKEKYFKTFRYRKLIRNYFQSNGIKTPFGEVSKSANNSTSDEKRSQFSRKVFKSVHKS